MKDVVIFSLIVGIGSTIVLDLWARGLQRFAGLPATDWGMVGRWLSGLSEGRAMLDVTNSAPPSGSEKAGGWIFHYAVGILYALALPLLFGIAFVYAPTIGPIIIIGLVVSTLAGLIILYPGMGGGFFASKTPNQGARIVYLIIAHSVFAAGQYGFARLFVAMS